MEKNVSEKTKDAMFFNKKIIQEVIGGGISFSEIGETEITEFLQAVKGIHFIMQDIITAKLMDIVEAETVEEEESVFDEYDRENGYEEEAESEDNIWKSLSEIVDRVIKIAIQLLKDSYSQCMEADILQLLDYIKFELDTVTENQE